MNQPPSPGRARPPTTNEEKTQARPLALVFAWVPNANNTPASVVQCGSVRHQWTQAAAEMQGHARGGSTATKLRFKPTAERWSKRW